MEFQFNVNEYFKKPIVEIRNTLLPPDFAGDRRALWNTVNKVAEVVNEMGEASAHAQGLNKPITTAERLRQSDQSLYLLVDRDGNNGNGAVTGMLKMGKKGLYVFDRDGQHFQVTPPCVLDFYVHEKRQRSGLGRKLFEFMLQKENVKPHHLAIDRPSDKFLNFLRKHYDLESPIKQMNNYVVFDGFFPEQKKEEEVQNSPSSRTNGLQSSNSHNTPAYGRYGAPRPPCSMGQIIHNTSSQKKNESASLSNSADQPEYDTNQNRQNTYNPNPSQYNMVQNENQKNLNIACNYQQQPPGNNLNINQAYSQHNILHSQNINPGYQIQHNHMEPAHNVPYQNQPLQRQMRMFPEREMMPNIVPQQEPQYFHKAGELSENFNPQLVEPQNPVMGAVWPTQLNQHAYQMSQRVSSSYDGEPMQVSNTPYQQTALQHPGYTPNHTSLMQIPQVVHQQQVSTPQYRPQQFQELQQNQLSYPRVQPQSPQFADQTGPYQSHVHEAHQICNHQQLIPGNTPANLPLQAYEQKEMLQPQVPPSQFQSGQRHHPSHYQASQHSHQTPENRNLPNQFVPKKSPPKQSSQPQQQVNDEKILESDSDTVHSLLQVDPKYFKPDPIHLKQPPLTPGQTAKFIEKPRESVASLLKAEEEFFENGLLRDKYKVPVRRKDEIKVRQQHQHQHQHQPYYPQQHTIKDQSTTNEIHASQLQSRHSPDIQIQSPHLQYIPQGGDVPQHITSEQNNHAQQQGNYLPHQYHTPQVQYETPQLYITQDQYQPQQLSVPQDQYHVQQAYASSAQYPPQQYVPEFQTQYSTQHYHPLATSGHLSKQDNVVEERQTETRQPVYPETGQTMPIPVQEKIESRGETSQYSNDTSPNAPPKHIEGENQNIRSQAIERITEPQIVEEKLPETSQSKSGIQRSPTTMRQSSYISNDFNTHTEGPSKSVSTPKSERSTASAEQTSRKRGVNRQYGLNDVDMRRKGYKSAIVKRSTEAQEPDNLEFGYPPQLTRKNPPPRTILTMRGR